MQQEQQVEHRESICEILHHHHQSLEDSKQRQAVAQFLGKTQDFENLSYII
jgi:hypothetical protein